MIDSENFVNKSIGNYRIVALIGSGGFGSVYRGEHHILKERLVAIKILHNHLSSPQELSRFLQEAQMLEHMQHPHIVQIFDAGIDGSLPYFVTEYAPHGSLRDLLKRYAYTPLPIDMSLSILSQVGEALYYAHQQHIVHRDLKPENILFNANDAALLADFGIASTLTTSSVRYSSVIGTPSYMAPEQFQGTLSKEGDQYALGCIAYELLTGHVPFTAPDFFAMGFKHLTDRPIDPAQLNPALPGHIEQAVLKAMAKQRGDRYTDVHAFIVALHGSQNPGSWPGIPSAPNFSNAPTYPMIDNRAFPFSSHYSEAPTFIRANTADNRQQFYQQTQEPTQLARFSSDERQWGETRQIPPTIVNGWNAEVPRAEAPYQEPGRPSKRRSIVLPIAFTVVALTLLASLIFIIFYNHNITKIFYVQATGTAARSTIPATVKPTHSPLKHPTSAPTPAIAPTIVTTTIISTQQPTATPISTVVPTPTPTIVPTPTIIPSPTPTVTPSPTPETLTIPFTSATSNGLGFPTQNTYHDTVSITISGDGQASSTQYSDAFYIYTDKNGNPLPNPDIAKCWVLFINGQPASNVGLQNYNSFHTYTIYMTLPQPATINFGICDGDPSDNTGMLTVTVTQQ